MKIPGPAGLLLLLSLACDAPVQPEVEPVRPRQALARSVTEEGAQEAPPGVPPEYEMPTAIHSLLPEAWWRDGRAGADAVMQYTGNGALLKLTLTTDAGVASGETQDSHILPTWWYISTDASLRMETCGGALRADAWGSVWNELPLLGFPRWGVKTATRTAHGECPRPATATVSTSLASNDEICYTIITEHYWYYPATGTFEYRFTKYETYCEKRTEYET